MSPQFVDFDGDGDHDIACGTYDGSPHVSLGDGEAEGWRQPTTLLDEEGEAAEKAYVEAYAKLRPQMDPVREARVALQAELDGLVPSRPRRSRTWLYENLSAAPAKDRR